MSRNDRDASRDFVSGARTSRCTRRVLAASAIVVAVSLAAAGPASAGSTVESGGGTLTIRGDGRGSNVTVKAREGELEVIDHGGARPGAGCRPGPDYSVICATASLAVVEMGDGEDRVAFDAPGLDSRIDLGPGTDTAAPGPAADDVHGGEGHDTVTYRTGYSGPGLVRMAVPFGPDGSPTNSITLDDRADDGQPGEGDNIHSDIEDVYGSVGDDDVLTGDGGNLIRTGFCDDTIRSGAGDDRINADFGDDVVDAGPGHDVVETRFGYDVVHGGPGDDKISTGARDDFGPSSSPAPDCTSFPMGISVSGVNRADCGEGFDFAFVRSGDSVSIDCERIALYPICGPDFRCRGPVFTSVVRPRKFRAEPLTMAGGGLRVMRRRRLAALLEEYGPLDVEISTRRRDFQLWLLPPGG